jgi:hypothetical protein
MFFKLSMFFYLDGYKECVLNGICSKRTLALLSDSTVIGRLNWLTCLLFSIELYVQTYSLVPFILWVIIILLVWYWQCKVDAITFLVKNTFII